jgi:hypothetical protein
VGSELMITTTLRFCSHVGQDARIDDKIRIRI